MNSSKVWKHLRSANSDTSKIVHEAIHLTAPADVIDFVPITKTHYAVYHVKTVAGDMVCRIGAYTYPNSSTELSPIGLSSTSPAGQEREFYIAKSLYSSGVATPEPITHAVIPDAVDVMWSRYCEPIEGELGATDYRELLEPIWGSSLTNQPKFTSWHKNIARIEQIADKRLRDDLRSLYDGCMYTMFGTSPVWGFVHGDAHFGNVLLTIDGPKIFDFDTLCEAPIVWDLTHLLVRSLRGVKGYPSVQSIESAFGVGSKFPRHQVDAALRLREVARIITKVHSYPGTETVTLKKEDEQEIADKILDWYERRN